MNFAIVSGQKTVVGLFRTPALQESMNFVSLNTDNDPMALSATISLKVEWI